MADSLGSNYAFARPWHVWYHHSLNEWTLRGYKRIFTITNIKEFWDFHNNIECIGGINNLHFFLMRDGVTPIWEDAENRNGGAWSVLVPLDQAYHVWEQLAVAMVGGTLLPEGCTGISINQKNNVSIIKIWNADKGIKDIALLPEVVRKFGNVIYRPHKVTH